MEEPEAPKRICVNTGEQAPIYDLIEDYFLGIRLYLTHKLKVPKGPERFEIRHQEIYQTGRPTEGFVHLLLYGESVVASVIETRDEMYWINFTFFKNLEDLVS